MREDATPLPSLSRSERAIARCDGTASGGRGGNFPECFDELCEVAEDYEENDSQQQRLSKYGLAVGLASWPVEVLRNILNSGTSYGAFVHRCIQGCRGVRSSADFEALFPIPLPLDDVWGRNPNGLGKERRLRLALSKNGPSLCHGVELYALQTALFRLACYLEVPWAKACVSAF